MVWVQQQQQNEKYLKNKLECTWNVIKDCQTDKL